ncbi:hypothetical protein M758_6G195100 [Ceratodon purpureus]|nr:hypothetical protein M758_6G195100 [Ceratodon purpureus]
MYHPSRGGVRGGRDQFNWDDVKGDKHRENYLGHSLKAPVGRWQKGKDLMWYARDTTQTADEAAALAREEIERVKQEEEEAMREALGLAPRRDNKPRVNRLDKREQEELLKRSKAGEEVDKPYAQGERVQGLGFAPVTKSEAPDKKDLLQRQAVPEEERPLAQVISQAHVREADKIDQELVTDAVKGDSRQVSDEIDKKRKRKEEKRAAKEQRREEKKAAKKLRREKRRRHTSTSSDEELLDRKGTRGKHRRHESDSSDEEHDLKMTRKDSKPESLGDRRNTRSHERDNSDGAGPHVSRRTREGIRSDESDEDMQDRPSATRVALGRKSESSRATSGRDARNSQEEQRVEMNGRKPSVANDRSVEERERNYSRVRDSSPRHRHKYDDREEREKSDRGGKYSGTYNREIGSSRRGRDTDVDEDTRRQRGGNEFRRQEGRDELSRRDDRHYSKDIERRQKRSPSPLRRKPRHDSD